jgi:hypothetical protein
MPKILVSIVNYCDPEFHKTVELMWNNAYNKKDLIISIVSEDSTVYDFSFINSYQLIYRHFDLSTYRGGVCWARKLATQVDQDYDYLIQFDSHTIFMPGWDLSAVRRYKEIKDKKYIIAYAPADYELNTDGTPELQKVPRPFSSMATYYGELIPGFKFPGYSQVHNGGPQIGYWTTCCYLFAPKQWVEEVGFDEKSSFNTEEFSLSLRTFSKGWKVYGLQTLDVYHHDSHKQPDGTTTRNTKRPWADDRKEAYWSHVESATDFLGRLMAGLEDVPINHVEEFFQKTGINRAVMNHPEKYSSYIEIPNRGMGMPPRRN